MPAAGVGAAPSAGTPTGATKAKDGDDRASPEPAPPAPRRGIGAALAAGLLAGLLGGAAAFGAAQALWPSGQDPAVAARLATLEQRVAALPTGNPAAALEPRLAALETGLRQAAEDAKAARATAEGAAKTPAADPGTRQALADLGQKVEASATQSGANASAIGDLGRKLEELAVRTAEGLSAGTAAIGAIQAGLRDLRTDVGAVKSGAAALETRSAGAEGKIADLSGALGKLSADLARLSPAAVQAGLRVVVAGRLDDALRAGEPLGPALGALGKLGVEAAALAPLQPFAEAGAPSAATLAAEFRPIADALTAVPPNPSETVLDKMRRLLGKVVTVRAVGDGSGSDVPGLVGRIEAALGRGALVEAAASWDRLPEAAKSQSAAWGTRLKGRVAADAASRRIGAQLLTALDAATR